MSKALVLSLMLAIVVITPAGAFAADDAPIANPRADETAAQIDDWLRERTAEPETEAPAPAQRPVDPRMHGEVGAGIGTNGYRSAYGIVTMPIGKTGTATVGLSESRANFRGRGATNRSFALSLAFGDAARSAPGDGGYGYGGPGYGGAGYNTACDAPPLGPFNRMGPSPGGLIAQCRETLRDGD